EEALRESEKQFREIANAAPAMLWLTDPCGSCMFLSRAWQEFTGKSEAEGLGFGWVDAVHPDDRSPARSAFLTANKDHASFSLHIRVQCAKGDYRWVTDTGRPRFDRAGVFLGYIGAVFDVHEQHELQRKLQFLDDLAEATRGLADPREIMATAARQLGEYLRVSRCAYADVEPDSEHFTIQGDYTDGCVSTVGKYHLSLFGPRATADMREGRTLVLHNVDVELRPDEGRAMFNAITVKAIICCPLIKEGFLRAMMAVHQTTPRVWSAEEITLVEAVVERCWAYIERARAEIVVREREQALQEQDRRKNEFLAMLAHELRNPLGAITNALEVQEVATSAQDKHWAREVMNRQTGQLARLVDDLLDVSRITSGKIRLHKTLLDAAPILDHAVGAVRPLLGERKHKLHTDYDRSGTALPLEADPSRLEQIVLNLLTNAAKYTESGGTIWLCSDCEGDEVVISVRDTGIGIAAEALPQMFELFTQGERSLSRSEGGLGLGLTIVKQLCELHGGSITARSEGAGKGSEFTVRLPAAKRADITTQFQGPEGEHPGEARSVHRILVVDDNVDSARGLARLLGLGGHIVETAHDGPSALAAVEQFHPAVVLLDIGLPGMNGYEVATKIRENPDFRHALIIAVSGYGQDEDRRRSREAGFDAHLLKPVDFGEIKRLLKSYSPAGLNR
ncbi:MAG: response regulator, partial [Verrucomicrobiaceae bacterium]